MSAGGGGGGGGGLGFYKLNLSGTPVPFPDPTKGPDINQGIGNYTVKEGDTLSMIAQNFGITVDELMQANGLDDPMIFIGQTLIIPGAQSPSQNPLIGKRFEDQRGIFVVNIYRKPDRSQRTQYAFITSQENALFYYLILEGENLQELEKYHNRPVNIWATVEKADQFGTLTARVDRFEVPFPDLQIQILRGTQKTQIIENQLVQLFTTEDGTSYVELILNGDANVALIGAEGDPVLHEALVIPGETYASYPTIRIFGSTMAVSPKSGEAVEMTVTADKPFVMDEIPDSGQYAPPQATIERVDLIYYVTNQHWQVEHLDGGPQYIQPAWRFYGHYSNGDEFEILVQALEREYLLPELAPYIQGG
jgi:murein DD-endopeptidase MepM/ murein hydrolase activator NlpD